jgi:hypothetical protein
MKHAFETFLLLYPAPYRNAFGREMAAVFAEAASDYAPRGFMAYLAFLFAEFFGVIMGAFSVWTEEYMLRSRRRLTVPFVFSVIAGTAITLLYQGCFYAHMPKLRSGPRPVPETPIQMTDSAIPLVMIGGALLFISVFSMAFVWNMRTIGTRAGRLKPIWMPGRYRNARTTKRHQTLHRHSGGERSELYSRGGGSDRLPRSERFRQIYHLEDDHRAD